MKKRLFSLLLTLVMLVGMLPMNSLTAYATELTEAEQTADTLPVLLGVNVTLADILDTSDGWKPLPVDKSAVFEPGTGTASVNFSNSVLYTNGSFSKPVETVSAGGKYYFYITVTSLPEYYPVDYSKISVDHINVTMYDYKVDFLYASEYSSGALTGMKFCFMATHNPAPQLKFDEIVLKDGEYLQSGTPITSVNKPSGGYAYYKDGILELNNYNSTFGSLYLKDMESVEIKVVGSNVLSKIEERYTSVNTQKYTDIAFTGDGSLTVSSNTANCVKTTGDVTVNGGNLTFGGGNAQSGLLATSLTVNGGELVLKGTASAINSGCTVDAAFIYVDENNTLWDGETDLSTYKYLRLNGFYVYVGGVKMYDGDYLAVGRTTTQTTKPYFGYAYYKDGVLTLNNYSYTTGSGYLYDSSYTGSYAGIYSKGNLTVELVGKNTLKVSERNADAIRAEGDLTFQGDGSLNATSAFGITAGNTLTVNSGTIVSTGSSTGMVSYGMVSYNQDIIINDGNVTVSGDYGLRAVKGVVEINGGNVLATGTMQAIKYSTRFTVAEGMKIDASTTVDGDLGVYVAANNDSYKEIVVRPAPAVYVGGVGMYDGDYLAVGATTTQTTKPSGGYAYYKDGTLTLNNYSYEGKGYRYDSSLCATVFSEYDLTLELVGTNSLKQTASVSDGIYVGVDDSRENLTIQGDGSLNITSTYSGISAWGSITVNGGTIISTATSYGMYSLNQDIIINDGNVTVSGSEQYGLRAAKGVVEINGGYVTATGGYMAISGSVSYFIHLVGLEVLASTTVDGDLGAYVIENGASYKKIVIKTPDVSVGGVGMYDGDYLAVGATTTQTTKPSGGYAYYKDGTLTLNNYSYTGEGCNNNLIYSREKLTIRLVGSNHLAAVASTVRMNGIRAENGLTIDADSGAGLSIDANGCGISIAEGSLIINGGEINAAVDVYGIAAFKGSITINGGDVTASGVMGIVTNDNLIVNGGKVEALAIDTVYGNAEYAIFVVYDLTVADGLVALASTTVDGELVSYVKANNKNYKRVVIKLVPTHTVTFKVDTTTVATKTVEDGKTVTAPADPVKDGYTFLGWYTDGGTKFDFTTPITGDITLTAKFEDATSNVKLGDVNGDDTIDYADIQCIYQHMSTDSKLTGDALIAADVNKDGAVDYGDIQRLYQHLSTDNKLS